MKSCFACGKERGFWSFLLGGWARCQGCGVDYCARCLGDLKPHSNSTDEWGEDRACTKCDARILVRIPLDYAGWA